jgi:hypothetical protein
MVINKDQSNPHEVHLAFEDAKGLSGPISMLTFGSEQYMWKSAGANGHPEPNDPPVRTTIAEGTRSIILPKASVTVLSGKSEQ